MRDVYNAWFRQALALPRSPNRMERRHMVLGRLECNGAPLFFPVNAIGGNGHLLGGPGSGKTAALAKFIEFLGLAANRSLIILDHKADTLELLAAALATGLPVRWFTDQVGYSTATFNWFEQRACKRLTPAQKAATLGKALGFTHGLTGYATSWFGGSAHVATELPFARGAEMNNFAGLLREVGAVIAETGRSAELRSEIRAAANQAWIDIRRMAHLQALNVVGSPHGIDLCSLFETPQIVYVGLPEGVMHELGGHIARLFVYSLFDAAAHVRRHIPVTILWDEFQLALARGVDTVLQGRQVGPRQPARAGRAECRRSGGSRGSERRRDSSFKPNGRRPGDSGEGLRPDARNLLPLPLALQCHPRRGSGALCRVERLRRGSREDANQDFRLGGLGDDQHQREEGTGRAHPAERGQACLERPAAVVLHQ